MMLPDDIKDRVIGGMEKCRNSGDGMFNLCLSIILFPHFVIYADNLDILFDLIFIRKEKVIEQYTLIYLKKNKYVGLTCS